MREIGRDRTRGERRMIAKKTERRKTWSEEERRLDDGLQSCIILISSFFYEVSHRRSAIKPRDKILTAVISFSQLEHDPVRKEPTSLHWCQKVYFQVDDHVDPGNCPAAVSSEKSKIFYIWSFAITCRVGLRNKQMSYFSSVSDEWSRDLKTTKEIPVVFKYRNCVHVEVPNKSDGWDYSFSSLEKVFASENVSDELKPKVLLCMLGDKVSNLLVNLGEELKDYESLKQVVLMEYVPTPQKYV
ncbi:hypothetical protein TNCV_1147591 [Trichonephila clavipes]|nr:hypothetical protein TNCV_1147591 [Trichonephila clavipes]